MFDFDFSRLLRMPDFCKPAQLVNGVILIICLATVGSVGGTGFLWFVIIVQFITSAVATVLFAAGMQDMVVSSLINRSLPWGMIEMCYSVVFAILSAASVWIALNCHGKAIDAKVTSAGYVAAAIFFVVQGVLFGLPAYVYYERNKEEERNREITTNPQYLDNNNAPEYGYQA